MRSESTPQNILKVSYPLSVDLEGGREPGTKILSFSVF